MSLEEDDAADGQREAHTEQEDPSPRQDPPNIEKQDEVQANASSVKQSTIPSEGERSRSRQEGEATLETPNNASAQRKTDVKGLTKKRTRDSASKQGSVKKRKETHEKS